MSATGRPQTHEEDDITAEVELFNKRMRMLQRKKEIRARRRMDAEELPTTSDVEVEDAEDRLDRYLEANYHIQPTLKVLLNGNFTYQTVLEKTDRRHFDILTFETALDTAIAEQKLEDFNPYVERRLAIVKTNKGRDRKIHNIMDFTATEVEKVEKVMTGNFHANQQPVDLTIEINPSVDPALLKKKRSAIAILESSDIEQSSPHPAKRTSKLLQQSEVRKEELRKGCEQEFVILNRQIICVLPPSRRGSSSSISQRKKVSFLK